MKFKASKKEEKEAPRPLFLYFFEIIVVSSVYIRYMRYNINNKTKNYNMLDKLKEISNQTKNTRDNINTNHSNLQLLSSFNKTKDVIKGICFAAVIATSATGCSSLSSNPYQMLPSNNAPVEEISSGFDVSGIEDLDSREFFLNLSKAKSGDLVNYEKSRDYYVDDIDAPVYTLDELTQKFKSGELFVGHEEAFLENPYEDNRLVKLIDARENVYFSGFGKTYVAPMFMKNPQLFSMDDDGVKEGLEMGINLDVLDHRKMSEKEFKAMVFHELNHGSLAQEIIVHSHHNNFTISEVGLQTKKLFGMDVSDDGAFYTRKLLESHSDVSSLISLKITEEMSAEELMKYLKNEIDNQAMFEMKEGNQSDEHRSLRAYETMFKMLKENPEVFDNIPLEEVPFHAMSISFDAGFYVSEDINAIRNYLDHRENFTTGVFLGSVSRDKLALNYMVEQIGTETETAKQLKEKLDSIEEYRGLELARSELQNTIEEFLETGEKDAYYERTFKKEDVPYIEGLTRMKEEIDATIQEKGYDNLLGDTKTLFKDLEKEWRVNHMPENYKDSPLFSRNKI